MAVSGGGAKGFVLSKGRSASSYKNINFSFKNPLFLQKKLKGGVS